MTTRFDERLFLVFVAALPVMQPFYRWRGYRLPIADFLFVAVALAFVLAIVTGTRRIRWIPWCWMLVLFASAMVASAIASEDVRRSVVKLAGSLYLVAAAFLTVNYVTSADSLRRALWAWVAGVALTALAVLTGLLLFAAGFRDPWSNPIVTPHYGGLPPGPYPRLVGLFLNVNMLCTYTVASAMVILAMREVRWIDRRVSLLLLIGTCLAATFTLSYGLGGFFLVLSVWWAGMTHSRSPRLARLCAIVGVVAAAAALAAVTISPGSVLAGLANGNVLGHLAPSSRVLTWWDAWQTFVANPWFGRGLGLEAAAVQFEELSGSKFLLDAHNTWLSILAQTGLLGLLAFVGVVLPLLRRFRLPSPGDDALSLVRNALQLAFIGGFLYQTPSGSFEDARHVWVLMGLVAAALVIDDESHRPIANR